MAAVAFLLLRLEREVPSSAIQMRTKPSHPSARRAGADAALQVLHDHWDGGIPVQPQWIAKVMGIEVVPRDLRPNLSGRIEGREGRARIDLNRREPELRQRFTLAHEIGHFVKNKDAEFEYVDHRDTLAEQGTNEEEVFANSFAAELLMPESAVQKLLETGMEEKQLARELNVSLAAIRTRLESLGWRR
jgi:Zn-dependent peptidase ImmA (M78 family)